MISNRPCTTLHSLFSHRRCLTPGVSTVCLQVRDQARRFITLVDELYNARTRLVCLAACPPDALFGSVVNEEPLLDLEGLQFETAVEGEQLSARSRVQVCKLACEAHIPTWWDTAQA